MMNLASTQITPKISYAVFISFCVLVGIGTLVPAPLAGLVPLCGLIFFTFYVFQTRSFIKGPLLAVFILLCGLIALSFLSAQNAVQPDQSLSRSIKLIPLLLLSFLLVPAAGFFKIDQKPLRVLSFIGAFTGTILAYELFSHLHLYGLVIGAPDHKALFLPLISKSVAVFVLLCPLFITLSMRAKNYALAGYFVFLCAIIFIFSDNQATKLSLIIMSMAAVGSLSFLQILTLRTVFISLTAVMILMPWIAPVLYGWVDVPSHNSQSVVWQASIPQRLEIWDFIARRILEDPWTGFGIDATRSILDFDSSKTYFPTNQILHPHNISLQLWIEFGAFGIMFALGFFAVIYKMLIKLARGARTLPFVTFCGVMVYLMVSWSLWSSWLIAFLFLLSALMTCQHRAEPESNSAHATA